MSPGLVKAITLGLCRCFAILIGATVAVYFRHDPAMVSFGSGLISIACGMSVFDKYHVEQTTTPKSKGPQNNG